MLTALQHRWGGVCVAKLHGPYTQSLPYTVRLLLDTVYSLESFTP
jgi:hypothetical protein